MDARIQPGFEEIQHTADWALRVWADDLAGLLTQAAIGMNHLMGVQVVEDSRVRQTLEIHAQDAESLLVIFLNELLFRLETDRLAFDHFDVSIDDFHLSGKIEGASVLRLEKQIKAVTFHHLSVRSTPTGLETVIVFDV